MDDRAIQPLFLKIHLANKPEILLKELRLPPALPKSTEGPMCVLSVERRPPFSMSSPNLTNSSAWPSVWLLSRTSVYVNTTGIWNLDSTESLHFFKPQA